MSFQFDLKIVTGDSAAAVLSAAHGLEAVDKGAKHAAEGVRLFEGEVGKLSGSVGGLTLNMSALHSGGSLFVFDLAEGARFAFDAVSKLVEKVVDLGKEMVRAVAGAETLGVAMEYSLGGNKELIAEFDELSETYARKTGNDDDFYKKAWLPLLNAGIRDKEQIGLLTTTALEVAALQGEGKEKAAELLGSLGRMALGGKIKEGALKDFNIKPTEFYSAIAKTHRVTMDEAAKMLKAGKLSSDELLHLVVSQVAANSGNAEKIGSAALARGDTLDATLQRLSDLPENIFKRLKGSEGMEKLRGVLDNFITVIEQEAPAALETFNQAFADLFGDLSGPEGMEKIRAGIKSWLLEFKAAVPEIVGGAKAILGVLVETSKVILEIAEAWPRIKNIFAGAAEGALAGGAAGFLAGGVGAIPAAIFGGVGGAMAASSGVQFVDPEIPNPVKRGSTAPGSTSATVTQTNNVTIHAADSDDAGHKYQQAIEEANRRAAVRVGQELSSYVGKPGGNP